MLKNRLLLLRKNKKLTQQELAGIIGITPQAYSLYETGKNNISNETLCLLADYFDVSVDYILGRDEKIPSYLNEDERTIIKQYRKIDTRGKQSIKNSLAFEYLRASDNK